MTQAGTPPSENVVTVEQEILDRIEAALDAAAHVFARFTSGEVEARAKSGGSPVTEADNAVNDALAALLPRAGEGWLSEETTDSPERLGKRHTWIVDPLDGTKEFVHGIPEWCVSIGFVIDGMPVAGGILNPATQERIVGGLGRGVSYKREPVELSQRETLAGAVVLASRSEVERGEWRLFDGADFEVRAMGSVAYKLGLVAAGQADATWTVVPKNEWDVAAGAALVMAAGGVVYEPNGQRREFNQKNPLLSGLIAHPKSLTAAVGTQIERALAAQS